MPRITHFDIPSDNPERTQKFYSEVFGWQFDKWDGPMEYWMIKTGESNQPGINGGMVRRMPGQICMTNTIDVSSLDEYTSKIASKGGQILIPKMPIPGVGYFATCMDTEGNIFGMMQMDDSAK
ncbi:MAG: VOC family protein [Candidatus Nitrosotalea sp.]|nr:VOC family protein [Candidatus Nitrosotalea sp.]